MVPATSPEASRELEELLLHLGIPFEIEKLGAWPPRGSGEADAGVCENLRRIYDRVPGAAWTGAAGIDALAADSSLDGQAPLIALSEASLEPCLRFGILTRRPIVALESQEQLMRILPALRRASSLFVSPPSNYTIGEMEALLRARNEHAPELPIGFFYPVGNRISETFALKSFLHSLAAASAPGPYTFVLPLGREECLEELEGLKLVSGRQADFREVVRVLETRARLLFVGAHSNGVDMNLGRTVLCAREDWRGGARREDTIPCFGSEVCCRKSAGNELYGVSRIRSDMVFLNACYAASFDGAFYAPETTLACQFAGSLYVRCLWATYSGPTYDPYSGVLAAELISTGVTAGKATLEINRAHYERFRDFADSTILFGDPEAAYVAHPLELGRSAVLSELAIELHRGRSADAPGGNEGERTPALASAFFEALQYYRALRSIAQATRVEAFKPQGNVLLSAVEAVQFFGVTFNAAVSRQSLDEVQYGRIVRELAQHLSRLHRAVVELFLSAVRMRQIPALFRVGMDGIFSCMDSEPLGRGVCAYCRQVTVKKLGPQRLPGVSHLERRVFDCLNCGPVLDLIGEIQGGEIIEPSGVRVSAGLQVVVEIDLGDRGTSYVSVCAALDPRFDPRDGGGDGHDRSRIPIARTEGFADPDAHGRIRVALPAADVDGEYEPGRYFLNVAILVDSDFALLRRCVSVL